MNMMNIWITSALMSNGKIIKTLSEVFFVERRKISKFGIHINPLNMLSMKIKIINRSKHSLPEYKTKLSAGMDVYANLEEPIVLKPLDRKLIPTGLFIELPEGYEAQLRPRSGLALNEGLGLLNSPGTIDADYRGEIGVIVVNLSNNMIQIEDGERICQMVIHRVERAEWIETEILEESERGKGGFGHTGK